MSRAPILNPKRFEDLIKLDFLKGEIIDGIVKVTYPTALNIPPSFALDENTYLNSVEVNTDRDLRLIINSAYTSKRYWNNRDTLRFRLTKKQYQYFKLLSA